MNSQCPYVPKSNEPNLHLRFFRCRSNMIRYLPSNKASHGPSFQATLSGAEPKAARALGFHVVLRRGDCCIQDWNDRHVAENEIHAESICTSFPIWPYAVLTVANGSCPISART